LLTAIRQIMKGDLYVSEGMGKSLVEQLLGAQKAPEKLSVKRLTDRELEIFRLVGKGRSTKQIAEELKISAKTVESHQSRIKRKLQIQNARGLIQRAIAWVTEENI
jgi:DNA-binding NarL/FixJ family response regulator